MIPSDLDIEDFLGYTACYDLDNARWRNIPRRCRSVEELFKPMRDLVFCRLRLLQVHTQRSYRLLQPPDVSAGTQYEGPAAFHGHRTGL